MHFRTHFVSYYGPKALNQFSSKPSGLQCKGGGRILDVIQERLPLKTTLLFQPQALPSLIFLSLLLWRTLLFASVRNSKNGFLSVLSPFIPGILGVHLGRKSLFFFGGFPCLFCERKKEETKTGVFLGDRHPVEILERVSSESVFPHFLTETDPKLTKERPRVDPLQGARLGCPA